MSNSPSSLLKSARIAPHSVRPLPAPASPATDYRHWIELNGSMTREIGERLGTPAVERIFEGPTHPARWERRLLGLRTSPAFSREIELRVDGRRVLAARTLAALKDPVIDVINRLGSRPLAELLFVDPHWQRASPPIPLLEGATRRIGRACLWRSGARQPSRILVCEYFEPVLKFA